jgi:hypothetical protein
MNAYHIPKNEQEMKVIFVVLSRDEDGTEGIVSAMTPMGSMPMVFGHEKMLIQVRDALKQMSKDTGRKLHIVKYMKTEEIETIDFSH